MSVIEDTRKVMQDFLAPELRAISARLDALEQRFGVVDKRFDSVDKRIDGVDKRFDRVDKRFDAVDGRFDEVERKAEKRHDQIMAAIAGLADYTSIRERVARLESRDNPHQ